MNRETQPSLGRVEDILPPYALGETSQYPIAIISTENGTYFGEVNNDKQFQKFVEGKDFKGIEVDVNTIPPVRI